MNKFIDPLGLISCIIIIIASGWCYLYIRRTNQDSFAKRKHWLVQLPSLISTLGVLGTFVGITKGLLAFDTQDLPKSIPELLDGLKTAFYTSLLGMIGSMIINRVISSKFGKLEKEQNNSVIIDCVTALNDSSGRVVDLLHAVNRSLIKIDQNLFYLRDFNDKISGSINRVCLNTEQMKDDIEEVKGIMHDKETDDSLQNISGNVEKISETLQSITKEVSKISVFSQLGSLSLSSIDNAMTSQDDIDSTKTNNNDSLGDSVSIDEDLPF